MVRLVLVAGVAACSFTHGGLPDAEPEPFAFDVAHVRASDEAMFGGTGALTIDNLTIDTTMPSASPALPGGVVLRRVMQDGASSQVALLEVRTLLVTGTLTVVGTRPLIVWASHSIAVFTLDAKARGEVPGPGGFPPQTGTGAGGAGPFVNTSDGGGGGAGFGRPGAPGGAANGGAPGGAGSLGYGDQTLSLLLGGSGGGNAGNPQCVSGGAGGGAIQLSAGTTIAITGAVDVGGGGGGGGENCSGNHSSGGGGGAGGAIYLQAASGVVGGGLVVANGGGGGGGGHFMNGVGQPGADGQRGLVPAAGGVPAVDAGRGGDGGAIGVDAKVGLVGHNGGGGGGAVGRIFVRIPSASPIQVTSSPMLERAP